jgi:hypothetical protein
MHEANVSESLKHSQPDAEQSQSLHPLVELTAMRVREFLREKEAVFWVFIFPVLMTFALGIAFRNTVPDKTPVAIEATTDAKANEVAELLSRSPEITATVLSPTEAAQALRGGKVSIVVRPENDSVRYRFDPTRPESRAARLMVDDVLQRGKGRADVVRIGEEKVTEPGARYVDFLGSRFDRNEPDGQRLVGIGIYGSDCALAKNSEALCGNTDAAFALSVFIHAVASRVSGA